MPVEATIKRIGGSTFALLPPDLVKRLDLHPGDVVNLEVQRRGATLEDIKDLVGIWKGDPEITRLLDNWAEERPWQDHDFLD